MSVVLKKSGITVRRMDFRFNDIPRYWFNGDVLVTHLLNAMSATFPEGERFFVESVRAFRDGITDPLLQKEVSAFIGQEAMHAKEHDTFNRYLEMTGLDMADVERRIKANIDRARREAPPEFQLAMTCALEHFTAILAEQFLSKPELFEHVHPQMRNLLIWHAIEETEHKGVAFDVYRSQVGDEELRIRVMRLVTLYFTVRNAMYTMRLMRSDGKLFSPRAWYRGVKTLWGRNGLFRGMLPSYLEYYERDFHPWQRDTRALVEEWKQKLKLDELMVSAPVISTEPLAEVAVAPAVKKAAAKPAAEKAPAKKVAAKKPAVKKAVAPKAPESIRLDDDSEAMPALH